MLCHKPYILDTYLDLDQKHSKVRNEVPIKVLPVSKVKILTD